MSRLRPRTRLVVWTLLAIVGMVALLVTVGLWEVHRSVPQLEGQAHVPGLGGPVAISRDALGTAVVKGASRLDVARGLGFVHAQERFFEMDLARRSAAGELSELFGSVALERDKKRRVHRMRAMLTERFAQMDANDHALLLAYADGVNAGLAQLAAKPWQYMLLRAEPRAWSPVDSLLVVGEMYWMLQGSSVEEGLERAQWRECAGDDLFEWLEPRGGAWDAPLDASVMRPGAMPGPERLDLRKPQPVTPMPPRNFINIVAADIAGFLPDSAAPDRHEPLVGSNNWAVSGARSVAGDAMLANDMHLGLNVPSTWFRAQFEIGDGARAIRAEGVTLPGVPALVVGSNGQVAWGFTNSYGQWFEWAEVFVTPRDPAVSHVTETLLVKGESDVALPIVLVEGRPIVVRQGERAFALNWVADWGEAYNLKLDDMLAARDVESAARIAAQSGIPEQNIVIADHRGQIAWTVAGPAFNPRQSAASRFGEFAGATQAHVDWARPSTLPTLEARLIPVVENPPDGQLWTANARIYDDPGPSSGRVPAQDWSLPVDAGPATVGATGAAHANLRGAIGDGGVDLGARARQIRDRLTATRRFDEKSLGAIQFDDEALFLRPWAARIDGAATARPDVMQLLKDWNGRADADQAGYRLVSEVRKRTLDALWAAWSEPLMRTERCTKRDYDWHARFEYPAEQALDQKPAHLLPRGFATWDAFLLAQVDATVAHMTHQGRRALTQATWGEVNRSQIRHPLSRAVPLLSSFLDMPSLPQSGDRNMPHVASPSFGQSERLVVAPGHEERATLSLPGGQSGHPMSPYYGAGHADWVAGRATPLLAGAAQHVLTLTP